jgi:hypothetical protein
MRVNLVLNTGMEGFLVGGRCRCESDQSGLRVTYVKFRTANCGSARAT